MKFLRKYRKEMLLAVGILIVYFFTRLFFLSKLPIFTDEAIYIRWAQIALQDPNWRFISLTDGKPPLQTWAMFVFLKSIQDPLIAGRTLSVFSGLGSMVGLWFLSNHIFKNRKIAFITALLYLFYPLALLHDRLALEDSLSAMWYIWTLFISFLLIKKINLATAYTLGIAFGGGVLTKSIGFISMALLPFTLLVFPFRQHHKGKLFQVIGYGLFAIFIAFIMYNLLRLSPYFGMISSKNNTTFIYSFSDWLSQPVIWRYSLFTGNGYALVQWFLEYFNITYVIFLVVGLYGKKFYKEKFILVIYFIAPLLFDATFGKVLYPRYLLFMTVVLLPIVGYGIWQASVFLAKSQKKIGQWGVMALTVIALLPTIYVSFGLINNPLTAPIPQADYNQYIGNWPAGWGVTQSVDYLRQQASKQKIYIATEGQFGLMPASFEMYLVKNPNVTIKGYWPIDEKMLQELITMSKRMPTYMYFYQPCVGCPSSGVAPSSWPVTPVLVTTENNNNVHATLYRVNPSQ